MKDSKIISVYVKDDGELSVKLNGVPRHVLSINNTQQSNVHLTQEQVIVLIKRYLNEKQAKICRHSVILDILSLLESNGVPLSHGLVEGVSNANDEQALKYLDDLD